jgi:hypothetical protein
MISITIMFAKGKPDQPYANCRNECVTACRMSLCRASRKDEVGWHIPGAKRQCGRSWRIAPLRDEPGLIAYECPACEKLTSEFLPTTPTMISPMSLRLRPAGLGFGAYETSVDYEVISGARAGSSDNLPRSLR